jgi:hypothetical protein
MWWNLKFFRPEPPPGFVPKINITYQCSAMFVKPKQMLNSELNVHWASFSHHIAKRPVGGSKSQEAGRYKNLLAINVSTTKIITHKNLS